MFYPTSVLITSFDILFFWVARMMMMGLHVMDEVPFRDVYLHALVRDKHGKKMSKSTGNVIDPLEVIDTYGTDALRFTLTAFAAQGREIKLDEERIEGYRFFINKIWNAARFVLMHVGEDEIKSVGAIASQHARLPLIHQWILSRTAAAIDSVRAALDGYRFNDAASVLYQFIWYEFCDWYLEWIKPELFSKEAGVKEQARAVLLLVFETLLKLIHPLIPFVTEELWSVLPGLRPTLMTTRYPELNENWVNSEAEAEVELLMGVITGIRNIRAEAVVHPSMQIEAFIFCPTPDRRALLQAFAATIRDMTKLSSLVVSEQGDKPADAASYLYRDMDIFVPLKGLVDVEKELAKLAKERQKVEAKWAQVSAKLVSANFLNNAPAEVIGREQEKMAELTATLSKITEAEQRLQNLG
jgi:valyl-tRNA synthetase